MIEIRETFGLRNLRKESGPNAMGDDEDGKARVEVKVRDLRQSRAALGGESIIFSGLA